ncbi:MAG TPA: ROK family protein [Clostridiaceae bacterium]|nr:ROK family protein [Clostridiaceae bacterium]
MYIGVDMGGTKIAAGIVDPQGNILAKDSIPTLRERGYKEVIKDMAELILRLIKTYNFDVKDFEYIGVGIPGSINKKEGILIYANNFDYNNAPIAAELQKYINLPVYLENDANCAALGEYVAGAAIGTKNSVTITLGTGIGGGIVLGGKIYSGFNDAAGELGHTVIASGGEKCTCGREGCWEAYASATALIAQTKKAVLENPDSIINRLVDKDLEKIDAKTAFDAERLGDRTGAQVVEQYIKYLAEGLTNIINIFTPEILAIGGGVSKEGENLLGRVREMVEKNIYFKGEPKTRIVQAKMGNDAGIVGAAMIGREVAS